MSILVVVLCSRVSLIEFYWLVLLILILFTGTVIIVATENSTIDIPPGSILENVVVQGSLRLLEH